MSAPVHWRQVSAKLAARIPLTTILTDVVRPLGEDGLPCLFPWEAELQAGRPLGQYHCSHCGSMVTAGVPHPDYAEDLDDA